MTLPELTKNQHTFPRCSLDRFAGEDGSVHVLRKKGNLFRTNPKNKIFTFNRKWDQKVERSVGKFVEDHFQKVVNSLIKYPGHEPGQVANYQITQFYALWYYRSNIDHFDPKDVYPLSIDSLLTPANLSDERKAEFDRAGVYYIDSSGGFSDRHMNGFTIHNGIIDMGRSYADVRWNLVKTENIELLISDTPAHPADVMIIPISPNLFLQPRWKEHNGYGGPLSMKDHVVQRLNFHTLVNSRRYVVARNINKCGLPYLPE